MMFPESEGGSQAPQTAPETALPATPAITSAPETAPSPPDSGELPTQATKEVSKPSPELSLREKIQKRADEVAARRPKDPVTGKFLQKPGDPSIAPVAPKDPEKTPEGAVKPLEGAQTPPESGTFVPNFKVKVMETEREIPELFRPLMKDEASAKAVKEIMEKAFGLDYVKPKLEETRAQLAQVGGEHQAIVSQIRIAQQQFQSGDIDSWLKTLAVPEERILQWVADKLEYSKLPPEQKAILDARKQSDTRAQQAEQQAAFYQQQHEQSLTQQVQMGLDSVLARPDVDVVAKAYDARTGKPGSFKAEVNRRGDYIWRTTNKLTPPESLVQELMQIVGPLAPPAAVSPPAQAAAAPAAPAAKTPVIPNISGRSTSALPPTVRSLADLRAKHKEIQDARRG